MGSLVRVQYGPLKFRPSWAVFNAHALWRGKAFSSWQRSEFLWKGPKTYFVDRLHEITVPTLFINGDKDRAVPLACTEEAHRRITGSKLHMLKDCGHWAQREMPEELNRVVEEFLRDVS